MTERRMPDPRIEMTDQDLSLQTDYSLLMYEAYHSVQTMVEAIDSILSDPSVSTATRGGLTALRGSGAAGDPDIVYGSIYAASPEEETLVGFQRKTLFVLNVLQGADARPTKQAMDAVRFLESSLQSLATRWGAMRQ